MFEVKVVPIDVINHPLQYGGKKLGHPVYLIEYIKKRFRIGQKVAQTCTKKYFGRHFETKAETKEC